MTALLVEGRFRGPAGIGNGGYVAGRMAALLGAQPAEVTLRRGWPLDVPLRVARQGGAVQALDEAGQVIAEAREAALDLLPPPPPRRTEAEAATRWFLASPYTHSTGLCFVCGSAYAEGVGLRVLTGRVEGRPDIAAALWRPAASFAGADGSIAPEFLWAALDCAGAFAFTVNDRPQRMLLGRITGRLDGAVAPGEACIVMGWQIAREGRKLQAGTALFGEDGRLRGIARALWVLPALAAG
ncbi:hypothetical protein [Paracraurococcus lichenis]|uniref:Thioesterase family protein n=1 Tax=Paracraurococcus lichenis TaxID=3064888 RepID=A0ABT9EAZ7_9PROT|nr:hypothetical protein [Paracraurococcus sp. LOR1-02]MDO9713341.1 hypothetical protein [Paracraurococcus sp. LOR1-02]